MRKVSLVAGLSAAFIGMSALALVSATSSAAYPALPGDDFATGLGTVDVGQAVTLIR